MRGRYETARRLRSTIGSVFGYAVATACADNDPTFALLGALTAPQTKSWAALTEPKAFGALLRAIDGFDGQATTTAALKLLALLFPRPGELRAAHWSEFKLDEEVWTVPEARMKMRRPHRVPLLKQYARATATCGGRSPLIPGGQAPSMPRAMVARSCRRPSEAAGG